MSRPPLRQSASNRRVWGRLRGRQQRLVLAAMCWWTTKRNWCRSFNGWYISFWRHTPAHGFEHQSLLTPPQTNSSSTAHSSVTSRLTKRWPGRPRKSWNGILCTWSQSCCVQPICWECVSRRKGQDQRQSCGSSTQQRRSVQFWCYGPGWDYRPDWSNRWSVLVLVWAYCH